MLGRIPSGLLALLLLLLSGATTPGHEHTNNWAVLVCASRYWFNYRHMANTLGMYRTVKRLGIPDSNIILMLADDAACNARNHFPATVFANADRKLDLYGENIEVDYRGYEVTVENFIRLLTGRVSPTLPRSKRLLTDSRSNVFVYMTGHGGAEFLKFQDNEEISAFDVADAFEQMWQKRRYNELLFMVDTCQANTMYGKIYSPNILATGSSELKENSYSHHNDADIGVAVIDSFTHYILQYMEGENKTSKATMKDLFDTFDPALIKSHAGVRSDLYPRPLDQVRITDFLGAVSKVDVLPSDARAEDGTDQLAGEGVLPPAVEDEDEEDEDELAGEREGEAALPVLGGPTSARVPPLPSAELSADQPAVWHMAGKEGPTLRAWGAAGAVLSLLVWRMAAAS
ncbi:hypothetical protein CALCODRAFT_522367 [Calocera cornea HHB12733]|uniref:GPI-anchor transamidase n=1 Tax=Calocera cornea HHB12733 TaxID=1353952 RepID=A0A165K0P4_9BASI|nr:hypothetical protein CALCODRAFT_522367 [Calocera cornea HHB12733]